MKTLWHDVRLSVRSLRKRPGFSLVVIVTLALGIGATTATSSFIKAFLFTDPPYKDADRLVRIRSQRGNETGMLSLLEVRDLKEQARVFEDFASIRMTQYNVAENGPPESLRALVSTWNLFDLLGVQPYLGQTWPQSHEGQRIFSIVISYDVWRRRFGGDPNIVGKSITLDNAPYQVWGVMPPGFNFPLDAQLYRRVPPADFETRHTRESGVIARLKAGFTLEQGQSDLDAISERLELSYPETNRGLRMRVTPFLEHYISNGTSYLTLLGAAVAFVLLIACVNVANLTLVRSIDREKELAIRVTLGAGRARLMRMMLTECLVLSFVGGLLGIALSFLCVHLVSGFIQLDLPDWMQVRIDHKILLFTFAVSTLAGLLTGLVPAWRAANANLSKSLKPGAKGSSASTGHAKTRSLLVTLQVALALILISGAVLMGLSVVRLQQVALGFDSTNLLTMKMDPPWAKYLDLHQQAHFYKRVLEEVQTIPGVERVGFNDSLPLAGQDIREGSNKLSIQIEGQQLQEEQRNPYVNAQIVSQGYFATMKIPLIRGRFFEAVDHEQTTPVAIINEQLAEQLWPKGDAIGKRIRLIGRGENFQPGDGPYENPWLTIAGVVGNVRQRGMMSSPGLDVYVSDQQILSPESYLVVRSSVAPLTLVENVKKAIWRVDPEQSVFDIQTMHQRILNTVWQHRLSGIVLMLFAVLALTLAAVGIYGVMNYIVGQSTREIGLRMALGAEARDVQRMYIGKGLKLVGIGVTIGIVGAIASARLIASLLFGVTSTDPILLAAVAVLLVIVAMIACYLPARRAAHVNPLSALRSE